MGKIALVVPNNLWVCPYVSIYTGTFDQIGVEYEVISWNRAGKEEKGIQFNREEKSRKLIGVLWSYYQFAGFVKKKLRKGDFDKVVVFSPQLAIFLANFLKNHYKGNYIIDYRDLSIEQRKPFGALFDKVLRNSYANVVSSPGFLNYLPKGYEYVVSHNFNFENVSNRNNSRIHRYEGQDIKVLTIGALRTDMNIEVINALGNKLGFYLNFVGKGISAAYLEDYSKNKKISNVLFAGYYKKEEEPAIYEQNTIVNIVYPLIPSHISALSNRFYNSLIYKRPMIVTRHTIQGDYAEKYDVGLVIDNCDHLADDVNTYLKRLDFDAYKKRCDSLLNNFVEENIVFVRMLEKFAVAN